MLIKRVEEPENIVWSRKVTIDDERPQAAELCVCKVHHAADVLDVLQIPACARKHSSSGPGAGTQSRK